MQMEQSTEKMQKQNYDRIKETWMEYKSQP